MNIFSKRVTNFVVIPLFVKYYDNQKQKGPTPLTGWIEANGTLLAGTMILSTTTFIGSLILVPWLVVHVPPDYFSRDRRVRPPWTDDHPVFWLTLLVVKNLAGYVAIAAGIVMLVLPGQGLLTIAMGIILIDFPGKYRLERRIISYGPVIRTINKIRRKANRKPLEVKQRQRKMSKGHVSPF